MRLSSEFWAHPFAHRGLHDVEDGRPENGVAAFEAAIAAGYAIELDVQPSADGEAMVFHDYEMERLTDRSGRIDARSADELREISLKGGGGVIPDLETVLRSIDGRTNVLIEIKDQSGVFGKTDGALERRVCDIVRASVSPETCAIMSFNPYSMIAVRDCAPEIARGLVSYDFQHPHDAHVDARYRQALADLTILDVCAADFVSYGAANLETRPVIDLRDRKVPIFCWTIRSAAAAKVALALCDQITFEGFLP